MALTNVALTALKPREKSYKKADGLGLYVEVMPSGSKLWRYKYRIHGVEKRLSMGRFPDVSLAEARRLRDAARANVAAGRDPGIERRRQKLIATLSAETTFGGVAREFIEKRAKEGLAQATTTKNLWYLENLPTLQPMPIAEIIPSDVLAALRRIEAHGRHEKAKRCRAFVSRVFRFAVATLRATGDPAAPLKGALVTPKVRHHAAITDPEGVGELLRAIDAYSGHAITRLALQIAPHLMVRPGELRKATWDEFNLEAAEWKISAERMKMRKPHMVPLSRQALGYLRELHALTGPDGLVFPAFHTTRRPLSENTMNQALRRIGYSKEQMTSHGWRSTASTLLNESNLFSEDAIERSLAHSDRNAVRAAYNRGDSWRERVRMHQWWSDYLDLLRAGGEVVSFGADPTGQGEGSNVIALTPARRLGNV